LIIYVMTNRSLAAFLAVMVVALWAMFSTAAQCHAAGGTVVRGLVWLECLR
jgi:hypothetical protein